MSLEIALIKLGMSLIAVLLSMQACYVVDALARNIWAPVPGRSKDYISVPKTNGYQSLHTTVRVTSVTVELQAKSEGDDLVGTSPIDSSNSSSSSSSAPAVDGEGPAMEIQIRTAGVADCARDSL